MSKGNHINQEMISQCLGERTNAPFSMEHPPLSNSSARYKESARMGTSVHEYSDQRTQLNLFYSASGPDMFALVNSILQEPKEPDTMTERSFPPSWTVDLENSSRYSSLFPMNIWDHENQINLIESQSSYEEKSEKASSTELLSRKLNDLQVTSSCPLPYPPFSLPSYEVLEPSDPQSRNFTIQHQPSNIIPEYSNRKTQVDVSRSDLYSSQIEAECYGGHQEGIARGALGASDTEKSYPVIQENPLCANICTYESPQFMPLLTSPFQQENSIPVGAHIKLYQNQQQNFPDIPSIHFNNVRSESSVYPLQDSSYHLSPGFQQQNYPYSADTCLQSISLNPSRGSYVTYKKPEQVNTLPCDFTVNSSVVQPFGSQMAPQKHGWLQNHGFSNCKENLKPHNSVRCPQVDLQAPQPEHLGEISRNISSLGLWPQYPSANRFTECHRLDSAPNGDHAGQKTWQSERRAKVKPAYVGPDWAPLDALRNKKKGGNLFDFVNPSFLHLFPLANNSSQVPNPPAFHPPPFSPSCLPFSAGHPCDNIPHFANGGASASHPTLSPPLPHNRLVTNQGGATQTLYMCLEECYKEWWALERERTTIEADLARIFPGNAFDSSEIPFFRLLTDPSQVDRLIWLQFQEQAKVCALVHKIEHLFSTSMYNVIVKILDLHLEAIHMTQARWNDEILNGGSPRKTGESYVSNERDVLALVSAVKELILSTQKSHTVLWCAFQHIIFSQNLASISG